MLRLLTNRGVMANDTASPKDAWRIYDALRTDHRIIFLDELPIIASQWRRESEIAAGGSNMWTDAYLAAFAVSYQAKLVTFDRALGIRKNAEFLSATN